MKLIFLWACPMLVCACAPNPQGLSPSGADALFASAYALFVRADGRECIYSLTDAGTDSPTEITKTLREAGYDLSRGVEVLHQVETPARCIARAKQAATIAGFSSVRARLDAGKDGIPQIP